MSMSRSQFGLLARALTLAALAFSAGCRLGVPQADRAASVETLATAAAETSLAGTSANGEDGLGLLARPTPPVFQIVVLHVRVPIETAGAVSGVWQYLREEIHSGVTQLALRDNGLRVGVGHADWWDPIRATFERVEGQITTVAQPVRVPAGFPLALELDTAPRDQTLFYVGRDGVLSGSTWQGSRNVLRVTYDNDPRDPRQVRMLVVPEVRKQEDGLRIVRTPAGLWQVPRHELQTFDAAGFETVLGPGEFIVIGPSVGELAAGLVGDAFLRQDFEGTTYISYVVLRPETVGVSEHE